VATANNSNYSWLGGGSGGSPNSNLLRIDYSNDNNTASSRGFLSQAREQFSSTSNANYGWFISGFSSPASPSTVSTIDRVNFSNDLVNAVTRSPATLARYQFAATGNSSYGWFGGSNTQVSSVERIDYSNDTAATSARGMLTAGKGQMAGTSNYVKTQPTFSIPNAQPGYGWSAGSTPGSSIVNRIDFSNDSVTTSIRGPLTAGRGYLAGASNSNYSWTVSGLNGASSPTSTIDRLDFSNDLSISRAPSSVTSWAQAGVSTQNFGWIIGGPGVSPRISTVLRIDFSNDSTLVSTRSNLLAERGSTAATGNATFAWIGGGNNNGSQLSTVERIEYSNDLSSPIARGTLATFRSGTPLAMGNGNYGWWGGSAGGLSSYDRVDFSSDTSVASTRANMTVARYGGGATSNGSYGWFVGGASLSSIDRVDFSNDTSAASARGPLTQTTLGNAATSNYVKPSLNQFGTNNPYTVAGGISGSFGWVIGGTGPVAGNTSLVDRINFNNDTVTTSVRTTIAIPRYGMGGTNTAYAGWTFGGQGVTSIFRINYASDTNQIPVRSNVSSTVWDSSFGNAQFGYMISRGISPSPVQVLEYATDTLGTRVRTSVSSTRDGGGPAGVNNDQYGWFGGGQISTPSPAAVTTIDRLDFANDSATALARGPLSLAKTSHKAVGNMSYGWYGTGVTGLLSPVSNIDRIDYANDTVTASSRQTFAWAGIGGASNYSASGNVNYGWFIGGQSNPGTTSQPSYIYRLDYSNDTSASTQRGALSSARYWTASVSNYVKTPPFFNLSTQYYKGSGTVGTNGPVILAGTSTVYESIAFGTFGWWAAGKTPGTVSTVDRTNFSNDTVAAVARSLLSSARYSGAGTSNTDYGWFGGGYAAGAGISTIDRLDYSNDSATATVRGPLERSAMNTAAHGNSNYGWFAGGGPTSGGFSSYVSRIIYSSDTVAALLRNTLNFNSRYNAAIGNANYGWFSGGINPAPATYSFVSRLDFGNDTSAIFSRGPLTAGRYQGSMIGNSSYGWYAGGKSPIGTTTIERIDYSNDLVTTTARGPLTSARYASAVASNSQYGWIAGTGGPASSIVDRIDFSNDSIATSTRGPLPAASQNKVGSSNYVK
jgi:hypothetical protein